MNTFDFNTLFNLKLSLNTLISMLLAFILGSIIGLERQIRQRNAGIRTIVLVCLGACLFVNIGLALYSTYAGATSPLHIIAYVCSGVGFLGAGVIMREEGNVRGINTAATLWSSAAIGCAAGSNLYAQAIIGTSFILVANTIIRKIVRLTNHLSMDFSSLELDYIVYAITNKDNKQVVLSLLEKNCKKYNLSIKQTSIQPLEDSEIKISAVLIQNHFVNNELEKLITDLRKSKYINKTFWSSSSQN